MDIFFSKPRIILYHLRVLLFAALVQEGIKHNDFGDLLSVVLPRMMSFLKMLLDFV